MLPYIKIYPDFIEVVQELDNGARGRLLLAIMQYANGEEPDELTGAERIAYIVMKGQIDRDAAAYEANAKKQSENGKKGGRPKKVAENEKPTAFSENPKNPPLFWVSTEKPKKPEEEEEKEEDFTKDYISPPTPSLRKNPTLAEVEEYAKMRGGLIDPKPFYEFYSVAGWRDTEGKPVYNWQQKFQLWEKRELEKPKKPERVGKSKDNSWMKKYLGGEKRHGNEGYYQGDVGAVAVDTGRGAVAGRQS